MLVDLTSSPVVSDSNLWSDNMRWTVSKVANSNEQTFNNENVK
jgi:hypothetical protein